MQITLLSVNLGAPRSIGAKSGTTGFYKSAQIGPVKIDTQGLVGDTIIDLENHGGIDQAVYVYCQDDYDWWHVQEGLAVSSGLFGENLTISGMSSSDAHVGGRLVGDTVTLEITSPRTPCDTFAVRMNDNSFPKRFWAARRPGFYCRVIHAGLITAGQHMQFVPFNGPHLTLKEWVDNEPLQKMDAATRQRFLSVPIHYKARQELSR
jgi:MOSC domain-containing protein YiiM